MNNTDDVRNDTQPLRNPGRVLDTSEYNQIADTVETAVDSAVDALRRAGMSKTVELIEALPVDE